ncbi:hypothetical protein [Synechocystis sp. PCC 7509]|uniref:hypothetical protein n=1 Tax=Synechocystis sp. PCC 7509 TaxID=927677 RepID=UPI00178C19E9|nr:hypothetical protein [Synechocystis sp. PCC 7509]
MGEIKQRLLDGARKYKDDGLKSLLEVLSPPGKVGIVRGLAWERLKQRLQEVEGFESYGQIQQWIQKELGLVIAYKTVYQLVCYSLRAKLKVPRPRSLKQHPESNSTAAEVDSGVRNNYTRNYCFSNFLRLHSRSFI